MIKRELYMSRIRPFIGGELIKVMTGIRRSGKSVIPCPILVKMGFVAQRAAVAEASSRF